jgi:8-oxo-dGTP pyrophosphatase MutT (NUDIX family)
MVNTPNSPQPECDSSILCMNCRSGTLNLIQIDGDDYYHCRTCGHRDGRAMYTKGIQIEYLPSGEPKHFSVGALIRDGDRFLIIKRRVWPYTHGLPAGHVDNGESFELTLPREVREELGVTPTAFTLLAHEPDLVGDKCRKGADIHDWKLFACEVPIEGIINNSDEAERLLWVSRQEADALNFAFASGHMLRKVGLLS